jgi:hypothetical protein
MISFRCAPPPKSPDIDQSQSWRALPGYDGSSNTFARALGVGVACALTLFAAWELLTATPLRFGSPTLVDVAIVIFALTVVHELAHWVGFPFHAQRRIIFGVWPAAGSVYVQSLEPIKRNRFVIVLLLPLALLSLLPLLLSVSLEPVPHVVRWISVLNGLSVGGDLLAVYTLLKKAPSDTLVLESENQLFARPA